MSVFGVSLTCFVGFFLLYFEPLSVAGIKFSHLWKLAALYLLEVAILMHIQHGRRILRPSVNVSCHTLRWGYLFVVWTMLAGIAHPEQFSSLVLALQRLFPLLILQYFLLRSFETRQLFKGLTAAVVFIALSTLPFHLGLLEPLGKGYDVVALLGAEQTGFVGIFQNQHVASLTLSLGALLAALYALDGAEFKHAPLALLLALFLTFTLLLTYARAGIAALVLGLAVYVIISGRATTALRMVALGGVALVVVFFLFPETDILRERLLGRTRFMETTKVELGTASSGRLRFWKTSLEIYIDEGSVAWVAGIGEATLEEKMKERLGSRIFSHNGFINELLVGGAIGFGLFLCFLFGIYRDIRQIREPFLRNGGVALFAAWLTFAFFQGGEFPLQAVLLLLFVAISISQKHIKSN